MIDVRVLHVEDEPDIREIVKLSLDLDPDFVTRSCGSGSEALAVVEDFSPDIILLDVMMPVMDGPTTLARLRDNVKTAKTPIVFMTACSQTHELELFRSLGIAGLIPKPFDPMILPATVRAYIKSATGPQGAVQNILLRRINDVTATLAEHRTSLKNGTALPATLAGIRKTARGLAGASGIFGSPEISQAATALEEAVIFELRGLGTAEGISKALDHLLSCLQTIRWRSSYSQFEA